MANVSVLASTYGLIHTAELPIQDKSPAIFTGKEKNDITLY